MEIREQRHGDALLIAATGRIDSTTSERLEHVVNGALDGGVRRMAIDLSEVEYISSAGLRVMLVAAKRLGSRGSLVLCGMGDAVRQVFELAGFLPLFTVEATSEKAMERLGV